MTFLLTQTPEIIKELQQIEQDNIDWEGTGYD